MPLEPAESRMRPLGLHEARGGMQVRVVKLFDESLMWYRNNMRAIVSSLDLDNGWAALQFGSCKLVLLSAQRANEDIPVGTAVCIEVETTVGLPAWTKSIGLRGGAMGPGPWGNKAVWFTDPEGNTIVCFAEPTEAT